MDSKQGPSPHPARKIYKRMMMEDLYVEIQDNRQLYRGIYQEDEMMDKIIQENMENLIRVK